VSGHKVREKSNFLRTRCNIDPNKKILLYFGFLHERRLVTQLVRIANCLEDDIVLVLHGWGRDKYLRYLRSIADKNKVIFSLGFVPEDEIRKVISSADIGIATYTTTNSNERLIAFSSTKMAYYAQCGVPVIAFDTESFRQLLVTFKCGELINNIDELPKMARRIFDNYVLYRDQAHCAFEGFYNLDANFDKFLPRFNEIISRSMQIVV